MASKPEVVNVKVWPPQYSVTQTVPEHASERPLDPSGGPALINPGPETIT